MKHRDTLHYVAIALVLYVLYELYKKSGGSWNAALQRVSPTPIITSTTGAGTGGYGSTAQTFNPVQNVLGQAADAANPVPSNTGVGYVSESTATPADYASWITTGPTEGDLINTSANSVDDLFLNGPGPEIVGGYLA